MISTLLLQIQADMKNALLKKEAELLGTIRLLLAAIKQREIDERIKLDDQQIIEVINKMVKQRLDAVTLFQQGLRQDLAAKELAEIAILKKYQPQPLSQTESMALINEAISSIGATSSKEMGKVIAYIKNKAQGRIDLGEVSKIVKNILENIHS